MNMDDDIWELLRETFVDYEFYVGNAEKPAFLIVCTEHKKHQLLMNTVGVIDTFKNNKRAQDRLRVIVENANIPVTVFRKAAHRNKKVLFAENKVLRIKLPERDDVPYKVFEIPEWKVVKP